MPTSKINKDAREGKGSKKTLEHKWDEAKDAAGKKGGKQNWPLTMYIYKKKTHQASAEISASNALSRLKATAVIASNPAEAGKLLQMLTKALGNKYKKKEDKFSDTVFQKITWNLDGADVALTLKQEGELGNTLWFQLSSPDTNIAAGEGKTAKEAVLHFIKNVNNFNKQTGTKAQATRTRDAKAVKIMNDLAQSLQGQL